MPRIMEYNADRLMDTINEARTYNQEKRARAIHFSREILKASDSSDKDLKAIKEEQIKSTRKVRK